MPGGKRAGAGRKAGIPNKNTTLLKDMILSALHGVGGIKYLQQQAGENPAAFMTLVGKVLPLQVTGGDGGPLQVTTIDYAAATVMAAHHQADDDHPVH